MQNQFDITKITKVKKIKNKQKKKKEKLNSTYLNISNFLT